jgi:hypothetical protein
MQGLPCAYFERRVIGPPDYPQRYRPKGYDYAQIAKEYKPIALKRKYFNSIREYEKWHTQGWGQGYTAKTTPKIVKLNTCNRCNKTIGPRRRYCDECKALKARESNRERARRFRLSSKA